MFSNLSETHNILKKLQSDAGEFATMATFRVGHYLKKMIRKSLKCCLKYAWFNFPICGSLCFMNLVDSWSVFKI